LLQDGNIRVSVFPEGEEIFVGGERPDAGGIGIGSLRSFGNYTLTSSRRYGIVVLP
jgi:hypothetical protein